MTWADNTYLYKKKITIDKTKVPADLTNFPVLIQITADDDLKDVAHGGNVESANGYDICFYDADDATKLKHELITYDGANGTISECWVKKPTLDHDADDSIYMYYGNNMISSSQNSADTWNANYIGVWHLLDGTTSSVTDSTSNNFYLTKNGANNPSEANGYIGKCQSFDGSNDYLYYHAHDATPNANTLSFIINMDTQTKTDAYLFSKEDSMYVDNKEITCVFHSPEICYRIYDASTGGYIGRKDANGMTTLGTTNWHHIVFTWSGGTTNAAIKIYIDGTQVDDADAGSGTFEGIEDVAAGLVIGTSKLNSSDHVLAGLIDEARFSSVAHDANWITTEYNNQSEPTAFYSIGAEDSQPSTAHTLSLSDALSISESLNNIHGIGHSRNLSELLAISDNLVEIFDYCDTKHIKIRYGSDFNDYICLHKPYWNGANGNVSLSNTNLSFRSGNYASYIDGLADEGLSISGYENNNAITKLELLSSLADDGTELIIGGLNSQFVGIYVIASMSYRPLGLDVFEYSITLKWVRDI